jgi:tetratricopeptide (TPR) repeat protein
MDTNFSIQGQLPSILTNKKLPYNNNTDFKTYSFVKNIFEGIILIIARIISLNLLYAYSESFRTEWELFFDCKEIIDLGLNQPNSLVKNPTSNYLDAAPTKNQVLLNTNVSDIIPLPDSEIPLTQINEATQNSNSIDVQTLNPAEKVQYYLQMDLLEEAENAVEKLPYEVQAAYYCNIAEAYFQQNNLEKAIAILNNHFVSYEIKDAIYEKFAISYCQKAQFEDSKKLINKTLLINRMLYSDELMVEIFLAVAEDHYQKGDFEKALETVSHLNKRSGAEDFYLKIGQKYIEQGELDKAATSLHKIIHKTEERDKLFSNLAELFYKKNSLEQAFFYNIYNSNYYKCKDLYIQVAQAYQNQGKKDEALDVLLQIAKHSKLVSDLWIKDALERKEFDFDIALELIMQSPLRKRW